MRKLYLLIPFLFLLTQKITAQTTFEKLFSQVSTDAFRSVEKVSSGGYILGGYTADSTANDTDAFVVRMNVNGDTVWTLRYNGSSSKKDLIYHIIESADGNFLACGYTTSTTSLTEDVLYMKIDANGQILWTKTWGGSGRERGQDLIEVSNGNIAITGYTSSSPAQYFDAFLLMTDSNGDLLWNRRYGSGTYDDANVVRELADGGFILGGQSGNGINGLDQYLIRTAADGAEIWSRKFGSTETDNIEHLTIAPDGFYLAGGSNMSSGFGGDDGYLVKTDTSGMVMWGRIYGGNQPDDFHRVEITSDGGLILSGTTSSSGLDRPNMWLVKTNAAGDSLWTRTYGGHNHDHGYSAVETDDGGFIFAGYSSSFDYFNENAYVVKTDANGGIVNNLKYVSVIGVVFPTDTSCAGATLVKVLIRNWGNDTLPNVPVTVEVSGATTQTLTGLYNGAFYPQDIDTVLIATPLNTLPAQTYTFLAYTTSDNDVMPNRNSVTKTVTMDGYVGTPSATNAFICGTDSATLTGSIGAGTLYWFTDSVGGTTVATGSTFTTPILSQTTTYYLQAGLNCASARVPVTVTAFPAISVDLGPADTLIGQGSTITLNAGTGFSSYQWSNGANTPSITAGGVDTFCVTVTDANGCTASDCIFIDNITGISSAELETTTIYPNPATNVLNIRSTKALSDVIITLTSASGQIAKEVRLDRLNDITTIDLSRITGGIYFLQLRSGESTHGYRLVVQ